MNAFAIVSVAVNRPQFADGTPAPMTVSFRLENGLRFTLLGAHVVQVRGNRNLPEPDECGKALAIAAGMVSAVQADTAVSLDKNDKTADSLIREAGHFALRYPDIVGYANTLRRGVPVSVFAVFRTYGPYAGNMQYVYTIGEDAATEEAFRAALA